MILRDFLDEVRFGNVSRLCVAEYGNSGFLDNYDAGKYWELTCGNWENGSESEASPEIPEAIMEAEVREVCASPNLDAIYANLGNLGSDSRDTAVILVDACYSTDSYWTEDNMNPHPISDEWSYNISEAVWDEINDMEYNWGKLTYAIGNIPYYGIDNLKSLTEEDFKNCNPNDEEILRLSQKIASKISTIKELASLLELAGFGNAFNSRL